MDDNIYILYTDGSCFGNPGQGGTGACLVFPMEFEKKALEVEQSVVVRDFEIIEERK